MGSETRESDEALRRFATTRWSIVQAAGNPADGAARESLEVLCQSYWYPLYAYLRRRGHQTAEAEDLIQGFFAYLLRRGAIGMADRERGRFRSFLVASLENYLNDQRRSERAQKRGGGRTTLSLDFEIGEQRYRREPANIETPERLFERRWALTVLENALELVRADYRSTGREQLLLALQPHLHADQDRLPYAELAARLGISEAAIKTAAYRLRLSYREALRGQIAEIVGSIEEVDDELKSLWAALSK